MICMIVCVCNRINCRSVRAAVASGARSPKDVQAHHGCRFNCGKCSSEIGDIISREMDAAISLFPAVAAE